ncbi:protein of unknown function [Rhodovastum atsumiense]|nr:protein of unknown function [Rhodovastum atsumiense]
MFMPNGQYDLAICDKTYLFDCAATLNLYIQNFYKSLNISSNIFNKFILKSNPLTCGKFQ